MSEAATPPIGRRALTGAAWMVGFRMCSRLLGVASTLILARLLSTADFGIVAIAFTISTALNSLSNVGITENLVRHKEVGRDVLNTGFTVQAIKGVVTGALLLCAAPLASAWFGEARLGTVFVVLAGAYALAGFENVGIIFFRRELRFDREFQLSAIERVAAFATTVTMAIILRNYWALVIGTVVSKVARLIATYRLHPFRPRFGLRAWHELAGFSLWMWLSSLAYIVWQRADPLVVGSAVSKAELGIFAVAIDIALLPTTEILEPIASVLFAGFAAEKNAGGDPRARAFDLAVSLMAAMAPIALVLSASSTYVSGVLLGPRLVEAAPIISIVTLSVFLSPFSYTASIVLTALGKLKANLCVVVAASVAKLLLLSLAARTGSLPLIAAASVAITTIESSIFVVMLRRNGSRVGGLAWPLARILLSAAAAAAAMAATTLAWAGPVAVPLATCVLDGVIVGVVGGGVYAGCLLGSWRLLGQPDGPERQLIDLIQPVLRQGGGRLAAVFRRRHINLT